MSEVVNLSKKKFKVKEVSLAGPKFTYKNLTAFVYRVFLLVEPQL